MAPTAYKYDESVFATEDSAKKFLTPFHTSWVDVLYFRCFSNMQRLRHRKRVLTLCNALERKRPVWAGDPEDRKENSYKVEYEKMLQKCPSYLLRKVQPDALEELILCTQRCYATCKTLGSKRRSDGGSDYSARKGKLKAFADNPYTRTQFSADTVQLVCKMIELSGPEDFKSPLYKKENKRAEEWWVLPQEARELCQLLEDFLEKHEEPERTEGKIGMGYCKYIMEKLDWFDLVLEQSGEKRRKSNHSIEIGPNIWKSKENRGKDIILYRIPELRIELMSFFRWVFDALVLKQLREKQDIFVASAKAFKESMEKIIMEELQETYQKWTVMKGKDGSFRAVAKGKNLRPKSAVLLSGSKVTSETDV